MFGKLPHALNIFSRHADVVPGSISPSNPHCPWLGPSTLLMPEEFARGLPITLPLNLSAAYLRATRHRSQS
jgi:hypothetical protein